MSGKTKTKTKKPGVVRRGQKRVFRKATNEVIERRVEEVSELLVAQMTKFQIHDYMRQKHDIEWNAVDRLYIPRAKKLLRQRSAMDKDECRDFVLNKLFGIVRNSKDKVQVAALKLIVEVVGIGAAKTLQLTGKDGGPVELTATRPKDPPVPLERLRQLIVEDTEALASNGN